MPAETHFLQLSGRPSTAAGARIRRPVLALGAGLTAGWQQGLFFLQNDEVGRKGRKANVSGSAPSTSQPQSNWLSALTPKKGQSDEEQKENP